MNSHTTAQPAVFSSSSLTSSSTSLPSSSSFCCSSASSVSVSVAHCQSLQQYNDRHCVSQAQMQIQMQAQPQPQEQSQSPATAERQQQLQGLGAPVLELPVVGSAEIKSNSDSCSFDDHISQLNYSGGQQSKEQIISGYSKILHQFEKRMSEALLAERKYINELDLQNKEFARVNERLKDELNDSKMDLATAIEDIEKAKEFVREWPKERQQLNDELSTARQSIILLNERLEKQTQTISDLEKSNAKWDEKCRQLSRSLNHERRQHEAVRAEQLRIHNQLPIGGQQQQQLGMRPSFVHQQPLQVRGNWADNIDQLLAAPTATTANVSIDNSASVASGRSGASGGDQTVPSPTLPLPPLSKMQNGYGHLHDF